MTEPFTWREHGEGLVVDTMLGGGLRVEVVSESEVDRAGCAVELPPRAITELAEWLDGLYGGRESRIGELRVEAAMLEGERDAALARAERAERRVDHLEHLANALQDKLIEVEQRAARLEREHAAVRGMLEPLGRVINP